MQARTLMRIAEAFPNCSIGLSAGEIVICDTAGELLGKLNFRQSGVTVYKGYRHYSKAARRLKRFGIHTEIKELTMAEAMHILYD